MRLASELFVFGLLDMSVWIAAIHPPVNSGNADENLTSEELSKIAMLVNTGKQKPAVMVSHQNVDELLLMAEKKHNHRIRPTYDNVQEKIIDVLEGFFKMSGTDWHSLTHEMFKNGDIDLPSLGQVTKILTPKDKENGWWYAVVQAEDHPGISELLRSPILANCSMNTTTLPLPGKPINFIELSTCAVPLRPGCRFLQPHEVIMSKPKLSEKAKKYLSELDDDSLETVDEVANAMLSGELTRLRAEFEELKKEQQPTPNEYADSMQNLARKSFGSALSELYGGAEHVPVDQAKSIEEMKFSGLDPQTMSAFTDMMNTFGVRASALHRQRQSGNDFDESSRKRSRGSSGGGASVPSGGTKAPQMTKKLRDLIMGNCAEDA